MTRLILSALCLFFTGMVSSQQLKTTHPTPALTKAQMYEDYDYFTEMVSNINAQVRVRKKLYGVDIIKKLQELRKELANCATNDDFYYITSRAIGLCNDGHSSLFSDADFDAPLAYLRQRSIVEYDSLQFVQSREANKKVDKAFDKHWANLNITLPLKYIDGKYVVYADFKYKGNSIKKGSFVKEMNGMEVNSFVNTRSDYDGKSYDARHKVLYDDGFYKDNGLTGEKGFSLLFETGLAQKNIFFVYKDTVVFEHLPPDKPGKNPGVAVFKNGNVLYIRVPKMNLKWLPFLPDTIKQVARHNTIEKVVIDIRGNGGGNDDVGISIIQALIPDTIKTHVLLLANNSAIIKKYLERSDSRWMEDRRTIPYLDNEQYLVEESYDYSIVPDSNSVRFKGNIYIIQDRNVFSAAGTLTAVAGYSDKVINAGSATGRFLGKGIDPVLFRLPNSHVMFRMEVAIDNSGVSKVEDAFHDNVKLRRDLALEEWLFRREYKGDVFSEEYLYKYDPVFRLILKTEADHQ